MPDAPRFDFDVAPLSDAEAALGLGQVLSALALRTTTPLGHARALAWPPQPSATQASTALQQTQEAVGLLSEGIGLPLPPQDDPHAAVAEALRGACLDGPSINRCAELARAALALAAFSLTHGTQAPALAAAAHVSGAHQEALYGLGKTAEQALDADGVVRDEASDELASLRARGRALRQRIRTMLSDMMLEADTAPWLQDQFVAVRHERHCLPINASFQSKVTGIVHGASQTGQTLFIEPAATVALGNEAAVLAFAAQQEELRILGLLSAEVAAAAPALQVVRTRLADFDVLQASAKLARAARLQVPVLADSTAALSLRNLRHPLLSLGGAGVVGNDLRIGGGGAGLIVSGPNAGGKTAVLTACGLAHVMVQRGLPIAAEAGSQVPFVNGCVVALGDGQSLSAGLSSFSAHLTVLDRAFRTAGQGWLVLIDEIGAATDPTEGAAIAQATMQALVDHGATLLVSTHLEALKALPVVDARFVNARMAVDARTLRPTYRLEMGHSGQSLALDAAERLPMAPALLSRAREVLAAQPSQLLRALAELERERGALAASREQLSVAQHSLAQERARLTAAHQEAMVRLCDEQAATLRELAETAGKELQAFRHAREEQRLADTVRQMRERARALRSARTPAPPAGAPAPGAERATGPLREGATVWVASLGQRGELQSIQGTFGTVAIGAMRMRIALAELAPVAAGRAASATPKGAVRVHAAEAGAAFAAGSASLSAPGRLDVRGLRADAAERALQRALDLSLSEGASELWVVHGHGTGALRAQVRTQLDAAGHVSHWRPGDSHEGGDGVTIASFEA